MDKPTFLKGEKIRFTPVDTDDLETYYEWFNRPDIRRNLLQSRPITMEEERDFINNAIKSKDWAMFTVIDLESDRLIGNISLMRINPIDRTAELGIAIGDQEYQGKGFGTEAVEMILEYGFNTLNLQRIWLGVHDFNERAQKSYAKAGFIEEGRKRRAHFIDGEYSDEIIMSILDYEWRRR